MITFLAAWFGLAQAIASPPTPDDEAMAAVRALSMRHGPPSCATLSAAMTDPAATWTRIAEEVESPPWVPIRAARCAVQWTDADDVVVRWMATPDLAGLATAVLGSLDALPEERAARFAVAALAGPHATLAAPYVHAAQSALVRAAESSR